MKNSLLKFKNLLLSPFRKKFLEPYVGHLKQQKLVLISEAAKVLGVSIDTVRRWDKKGILHSERIDGKNRYFSISELEKIKFAQPLTISQVSKQLDISQSTLRRLEEKGLIKPDRNDNEERLYSRQALEKFLNSEYFLRQKKVEAKILQPLIEGDTEETAGSSTQKVLTMLQQETSENVSRLLLFRKAFFASGLFLITTLILLVTIITASFILFPFETAKFFGFNKSKPKTFASGQQPILAESGQVLGITAQADKGSVLGAVLKPVSRISLGIVKQISPETYQKIVPKTIIEDVNDILTINGSGDIETFLKLTFPDTSYIKIPDTDLVQNLNADFLRGKTIGNEEGDIAVLGKGGVIKALIDQIGITDIKSSSARLTVKTSDKVSTLSLDLASLSGDIEEVGAGSGLTGGGTSGSVTLKIGAGTGITVGDDDISINQAFTPTWSGLHTFSSSTPITISSTSPSISIGNTGTLSITDGSNTLLTLADNGSTGKLGISGNVGIGVSFAGSVAPANGLAVSGNVGIGTSSPSNPLTVIGNANITGVLTVSSCTGCGSGSSVWSDLTVPTADLSLSMANYRSDFNYTTTLGGSSLFNLTDSSSGAGTGYLFNIQTLNSSIKPFHISANGTEAVYVNATGNLGIGTTSLDGKVAIIGGNVGIGTTTANSTLSVAGSAHIGTVRQGISAPTNGLFVDGNVGIGATSTAYNLDVWGTGRFTSALTVAGNLGIGNSLTVNSLTYAIGGLRVDGLSDLTGNVGIGSSLTSREGLTIATTTSGALTLDSGTTGAVNLGNGANAKVITIGNATTSTSITLTSGTGGLTFTSTATTSNGLSLTDTALTTGSLINFTSTNNSAANTAWAANVFNITNDQGTTAVSTGSIAGLDIQFTQNTSVNTNTETAARIAVKQNDAASTDNTVASLLAIENNDTSTGNQISVTDGLKILAGVANNIVTGINLSGTFLTNLITSSNFTVTNGGAGTFAGAIAANAGITFDNSTDTLGAFTAAGTIDMSAQILTNIGNTGTDFVASTGALTLAGVLTANGGVTVAGGQNLTMSSGTGLFSQTHAVTTDATADAMSLTLSAGGTGETGALKGLVISQSDTATTGVYDSLASIINLKTPETTTNGLLIEMNAASGTLTNGLNVTNTAGTLTNGLTFTGTFTKLINSTNFNVTNAGAVTAVGVNSGSGLIQGSGGLTISGGAVTLTSASSLIIPNSGGYAPTADASLGYDTTQDAYVAGGAGALTGKLPRVLSVQNSTTDTLTAATINTTETAFATTFTIPANFLIANKLLKITVVFDTTTSATALTQNIKMRVQKTGPTNANLVTWNAATNPGNSLTSRSRAMTYYIQGTAAPGASVNVEASIDGIWQGGNSTSHSNATAQPVAIDTASDQVIQFTMTYSGNTAGNTVTLRQMIVEELF